MKQGRLLVVDASVAQSAGETEHPVSSACRKCLEAIRLICHRVVVTPDIQEEWDRHMSRFTRKWRRSMAARRKPVRCLDPANVSLDLDGYATSARSAIEKDLRLLQAALAADRVIVTRDESLRVALEGRPDGAALAGTIKWINPVTDDLQVLRSL
jgi:hypothetical protein